jgi:hypothetical protein
MSIGLERVRARPHRWTYKQVGRFDFIPIHLTYIKDKKYHIHMHLISFHMSKSTKNIKEMSMLLG